ncbi:Tfp pilus assembly protein tip-associated adhesin PilY1-like protein [Dethiosulfovibrio peptidovorans DSM 11002]|uniref:Tfp pilus assembly protein tip-associated adhesin PilY1-like protein n=1 Tax=Dethiosulfovibrio peptidovorans DSM 11002 TaxID=469381 RepID=D2Z431_9BACT|nr:PilC/PilY family type IV pilus protein [Dethiosulfovibrio peptidovorans]EFC92292.1 Tfp pilus assembly protein tip-associated adhesin PilY1-like protein [Dethiosulfovibrio peptidovorans DSM 11002]
MIKKKTFKCKYPALYLVLLLIALFSCTIAMANDLPSVFKPVPEEYSTPVPPNVLLLIDTSGSMLFDLEGDTTHGDGSKPFKNQAYYGDDTDSSNNDPDDGSLSYYPPVTYLSDEEVSDLRYDTLLGLMGRKGHRYLHPNDSRMYILKKVLWSIFTDPSMVEGLKIGLCTYHQREKYGVPGSGYVSYEFPSYAWLGWYWKRQKLSWQPTGENKAVKRLSLDVIDPFFYAPSSFSGGVPDDKLGTSHWYDLLALIDGVETSKNDELRAVGATPLEKSIYSKGARDCAYEFIKEEIDYPCQDNWLIVLTDGEDSSSDADPPAAVKKLYEANLDDTWPKPYGKKAQPVRTFVIGLVDSQSDTLDAMADEGRAWEVDESIKKTAYYATDTESLLEAFRTIFRTIQKNRSSSAPPKIEKNLSEEGNIIYAASFIPKSDGAWPGYIYKKKLTSSGGYKTLWEGSDRIDGWDRRDIYHAPWYDFSGPYLRGSNLRGFPTSGALASTVALHSGVTRSLSDNFVRWIRGGLWGGSGNRVNPMLDLYRGDILVMGKPPGVRSDPDFRSFSYDNRLRDKVVFSQGNGGLLQVFDDKTGDEILGFIPPNVLHKARIAGLIDNSVEPEMGSSKYLLAGPLVIEDVKIKTPYGSYDERYRTILLGALGYGGTGIYALDVTDPEKPLFLWARDSVVYSDNLFVSENNGLLWGYSVDGSSFTSGDKAAPRLRRVIGRPFIGWIDDGWDRKWLAIFGGGAGKTVKASDGSVSFQHDGDFGGRAIYALDVSDGSVFKSVTDEKMGQIVADIAVAKGDGRPNYLRISRSYVGDSYGQVWRLNWEGVYPDSWTLDAIGDFSGDEVLPPLVHRLDLSMKGDQRWIFASTGDPYDLIPRTSMSSTHNCLLGFKEPKDSKVTREDLKKLVLKEDCLDEAEDYEGWIVNLSEGEYSTTPPVIYKGNFFGSTYVSSNENPCEQGISRLYVFGAFNGLGAFSDDFRYISLPGIKITGMVVKNDKVVMGILNPMGKKVEDLGFPEDLKARMDPEGAVISMDIPEGAGGTPADDGIMRSGYWRRVW